MPYKAYMTDAGRVREAAEILASDGWCKNTFQDNLGRKCAGGALRAAWGQEDLDLPDPVTSALVAAVTEQFPERIGTHSEYDTLIAPLVRFNDHKETAVADVIAVLEKAAVQLEEQA